MAVSDRFRLKKQKIDYWLFLAVFVLAIIGVVMISSASAVVSYKLYHNEYSYMIRQLTALGIGILGLILTTIIDYRFWQKTATTLLLITLGLLIAVFVPFIGLHYGGAHRWIDLRFTTIQPSEIIKLTFLVYLAAWLTKKGEGVKSFASGFLPFIAILGLVVFLIMAQPDMGTMSVIAVVATAIFFVSGAKWSHIALFLSGASALFIIFVFSASYRSQRLMVFLNPNRWQEGAAYHINQALVAIGSGGLLGLGFGQSRQKYLYLPMPQTDSIFAVMSEELGFLRVVLIILLYLFIAWRGYRIAARAPDMFARLVATGITTWIAWQALVNIGAMVGLLPLTGVPLPFISFGGSSLVMTLIGVGILLNISRQAVPNP